MSMVHGCVVGGTSCFATGGGTIVLVAEQCLEI